MSSARDLCVEFDGMPGPLNAITDVGQLRVGYTTLVEGDSVRTGVTAIVPRGPKPGGSCFAGIHVLNGNGEMTGTHWIEESGFLDGPVLITNTHSVGVVRDAVIQWQKQTGAVPDTNRYGDLFFSLPVVAETADFRLNDLSSPAVMAEHVFQALESAVGGEIAQGNVGGGTGMICHGWKGGTGTASRLAEPYRVGVLVQANHGRSDRLTICGVPVGQLLHQASMSSDGAGSIIVIVATDAPLLPHQLKRLAKRASFGIARTGGLGENSSGDILLAFSVANADASISSRPSTVSMLPNNLIDPLFAAAAQATEEAIINALFEAETMTGFRGFTARALPRAEVAALVHDRRAQYRKE